MLCPLREIRLPRSFFGQNSNSKSIDKNRITCYFKRNSLHCKNTVQTEQTVTTRHGVGSLEVTVEVFPHGTVVANILVSWGFLFASHLLEVPLFFHTCNSAEIPTYSECRREILLSVGGN